MIFRVTWKRSQARLVPARRGQAQVPVGASEVGRGHAPVPSSPRCVHARRRTPPPWPFPRARPARRLPKLLRERAALAWGGDSTGAPPPGAGAAGSCRAQCTAGREGRARPTPTRGRPGWGEADGGGGRAHPTLLFLTTCRGRARLCFGDTVQGLRGMPGLAAQLGPRGYGTDGPPQAAAAQLVPARSPAGARPWWSPSPPRPS